MIAKLQLGESTNAAKPLTKAEKQVAFARAELAKAKAEIDRVKAEADEQAIKLRALEESRRKFRFRLRVAAVAVMSASLTKLAWMAVLDDTSTPKAIAPLPRAASSAPAIPKRWIPDANSSAPDAQVNRALNRLRDAFHAFPGRDQMDVVREINEKSTDGTMGCPLVWNDGIPSLYVGDKSGALPPSMVQALDRCAAAVEELREERPTSTPR